MNFYTAVVVIVAIVAFASMRIAYYNRKHGVVPPHLKPADDGERERLRREVEELRERMKVLERITTDANSTGALQSRRVADEIESLRDR